MFKMSFIILLNFVIILFFCSQVHSMKFYTNEEPPLSFTKDGLLTGLAVDIVKKIQNNLKLSEDIYSIEWAEAYNKLLNENNIVLFPTTMTPQRKNLFKWVGPIFRTENAFYSLSNSNIEINDLNSAKEINKIITVKDYSAEQILLNSDFNNIESIKNFDGAFNKFINGDAELFAADNILVSNKLNKSGISESFLKKQAVFQTSFGYIAFSKDTPDSVVQIWQEELNKLKLNGDFQKLYSEYLPDETAPGILQLVTEDYPPITFEKDGEISGLATEVVKEIMKRLNISEEINLLFWDDAYQMALLHPNVLLFSTTKTEKRENSFHWIGPIGSYSDALYSKKGANIQINSIEEAKKVDKIGTVAGWFSEEFLNSNDFNNLESHPDPIVNVQKLINGTVDLGAFTDLTAPEIFKKAGINITDLEKVFTIKVYEFYLTISLGTPPDTVKLWHDTFEEIKKDGTFKKILKKWVP